MITINAKIDYNFDINVKIDDIKKGIKYFKNEITLSMESNSKIKLTDGSKSMLIDYVDDLQDKIFQGLRMDHIVKNEYVTDLQALMTRLDKVSMSFAKDNKSATYENEHGKVKRAIFIHDMLYYKMRLIQKLNFKK